MLAINLAAIGVTVLWLAAWLRRRGLSGWWALVYGFFPGTFQAFQLDLTEVSAYALVAAGIYLFEFGGHRRVLWAGLLFGLAALTREVTLVFPAVYTTAALFGAGATWRKRLLEAVALGALAAGPFLAYKAFLALVFGSLGLGFRSGSEIAPGPLAGLLSFSPLEPREWIEVVSLVVPSTLIAALAIYRLGRGARRAELVAYLLNFVLLVLLLQRASYSTYVDSGRVQTGVVLAAVLALPQLLGRAPSTEPGAPAARSAALPVVALACLLWFAVIGPALAAPHVFHAFKL